MPFARLTMTPALDLDFTERLSTHLTRLISDDLAKRHDLTSVVIEPLDAASWTIGAKQQNRAVHLEVTVTAGTNSASEKKTFITNAMAMLRDSFPDLHRATYIVIREVPATNWGFDGRTQADRATEPVA